MPSKLWKRRSGPDTSQRWRAIVQASFLFINVCIGFQFLLFVWHFEGRWTPFPVSRPPGVEGWLPIAGLMNLRYFLQTGSVPVIHPAAMVLVAVFLFLSFAFRKAFCGWLCPIGAISEQLWKLGRATFRRNVFLPRWLDIPLRSLKYVLLAAFLYAVFAMPISGLAAFLSSPYGLIADVKMLNFFRYLSAGAAIFIGAVALLSIAVPNAWCRYLCPYGALMGLAALASPARIRRSPAACIDCGKCARACPSHLPVDTLVQIRSAECLGCLECVAACPAQDALAFTLTPTAPPFSGKRLALSLAAVFFSVFLLARLSGHWHSPIPDSTYRRLIPAAQDIGHPR